LPEIATKGEKLGPLISKLLHLWGCNINMNNSDNI